MATSVLELDEKVVSKKEAVRQKLLDEAKLGLLLGELGADYNPDDVLPFQSRNQFATAYARKHGLDGFVLPGGNRARAPHSTFTPFKIVVEDHQVILYDGSKVIGPLKFPQPHPVSKTTLSTGEKFNQVANVSAEGGISVGYSTECSLKDAGEDCLFCSINVRDKDGSSGRIQLKTARQVAEAYHLARQAGEANHFRITGGFVPERRELEYYLDVADAIREYYSSFYGVAIIGAPADITILHKYKEAGFTNISHNLEVWDKNIFATICPGKEKRNGGWQHWIESLEYAVSVFGKGNVHSNLVSGLAPKDAQLEGIEYLATKGVVCHFNPFRPQIDTPLEGYRSPTADWHWDVLDRATDIYKRYGFNTLQLYSGPASGPTHGPVFQIKNGEFEGDTLPQWRYPELPKN